MKPGCAHWSFVPGNPSAPVHLWDWGARSCGCRAGGESRAPAPGRDRERESEQGSPFQGPAKDLSSSGGEREVHQRADVCESKDPATPKKDLSVPNFFFRFFSIFFFHFFSIFPGSFLGHPGVAPAFSSWGRESQSLEHSQGHGHRVCGGSRTPLPAVGGRIQTFAPLHTASPPF